MAGTKRGGKRAAAANKSKYDAIYLAKYGMTFYQYNGHLGGKKSTTGGFYADRALASAAGAIGGAISRRGYRLTIEEENEIRRQYGAPLRTA